MPRSVTESPVPTRRNSDLFPIRMAKLVVYALDPSKAERCKKYFMLNSNVNPRDLKVRQTLQKFFEKNTLNDYISKVLTSKTYLHKEGRIHIERSIRFIGIIDNKLRRKVR